MQNLLQYFHDGGFLMWPLLACSLLAIAVILERAVRLRRGALIDPRIVDDIQSLVENGQIDQAISRHRHSSSLVGRVLAQGLEEFVSTAADIETALTESGERGLQVLNNNLSVLNLVARIAPLLGLLGTVLGMISGFTVLELSGVGKEELAKSIRIALITTATGLEIAIPAVVAGAYFRARVRRLQAEFEEIFIDVIKSVKQAAQKHELKLRGTT